MIPAHKIVFYDNLEDLFKNHYEPEYCKVFGCGKTLTLEEKLAGNHCREHIKREKVEPTKYLSF